MATRNRSIHSIGSLGLRALLIVALLATTGCVSRAWKQAVAEDGTTFDDFLDQAEQAKRRANQRRTRLEKMLPLGKGLAPCVRDAVAEHVEFHPGEEPLAVVWEKFKTNDFVDVDRPNRTLRLNRRYRPYFLGKRSGSLNDVPMLKSLLYLLFEDVFAGAAYGPKDKLKVALWTEVLNAAAQQEERSHE